MINKASVPTTFTYTTLKENFEEVLGNGYKIITCREYLDYKRDKRKENILVNRVDIDHSCRKSRKLGELFNQLGITATFFVRLHAPEYNPFDFENYRCLKFLRDSGHEIGYHSEIIDAAAVWREDAADCLIRDVKVLSSMLDVPVTGVASHRGMTGLNNLDFWKSRTPAEFGLLYEAYDTQPEFNLFQESFYVSDSDWTHWKCYNRGELVVGDRRSLGEHSKDNHPIIYSLIHTDTYYTDHFYE